MDTKIEQRAPDAPLAAPKWGTFDEFVAWFMKQPDDRVFDGVVGRCLTCVVAAWLSDYNKRPIYYNGALSAYFADAIYDPETRSRPDPGMYRQISSVVAIADSNPTATKRELLDLGILS